MSEEELKRRRKDVVEGWKRVCRSKAVNPDAVTLSDEKGA